MSKTRKIKCAAINIKFVDTNKQRPNNYAELFRDIQSKGLIGHGYSKQALLVNTLARTQELGELVDGITGSFHKYFDLPENTKWFDTSTRQPISDKNEVIAIPHGLKPEYTSFGYVFFPKRHRLIFDCSKMSAKSVHKALSQIFSYPVINKEYGDIDVIIETSREMIDQILNLDYIRMLNIKLTIPNPDELSELDAKVFENMKIHGLYSYEQIQSSKKSDGMTLRDQDKSLIRLSASNGKTTVKTIEGGEVVEKSTSDYPLIYTKEYQPDTQPYSTAIVEAGEMVLRTLQ
ncbi:MAG: DUF4747 family protein [Synergistaceae bacterium]